MPFRLCLLLMQSFALVACGNPLSDSTKVDENFYPGLLAETGTAFEETYTFNSANASAFNISSSDLEFTTSTLQHRLLSIDADNSSLGFAGAISTSNLSWSSSSQSIELTSAGKTAGSGDFTSRIFTSASAINWTKLEWKSDFPSGKNYPNSKAVESGYTSRNLDMTDNVLLLHMDESSWNGTSGQVADSSGSANNGTSQGTLTTSSSGRFSRAGNFTSNGNHYVTIANSSTLDGTDKMSFELWMYPTTVDANPRGIISKRVGSASTSYSIFGFTGGNLHIDIAGTGANQRFNTGYTLQTNTWQHIAITYDGTLGSNRLKYYVNGSLYYQAQPSATAIPTGGATSPLYIGGLVGNTTNTFLGRLDEVAIYRRVLQPTEIANRFVRGSRRILLQARACAISDCSDQSFVGGDGTGSTYFTESSNTSVTSSTTSIDLAGFTSKNYFQYRCVLQTDDNTDTPKLLQVSLKPDLYSYSNPTATTSSSVVYKTLSSFSATTSGTIKFQLGVNSKWYYHNGTTWTEASGYSQSNSAAQVNSNIASFASTVGTGSLLIKAYFDAGSDSTTQASLAQITVGGTR